MASAGVGSRRECELIIQEGRVEVDGQIVMTLGTRVDPHTQEIFVDGSRLKIQQLQYFALNKPPGIVSTSNDPAGRLRVIDLIDTRQRVYNVGRLDQSSEGLILVTNDGELANRLTHPRYGVEKKYHVKVDGFPTRAALKQLEEGVYLAAEGKQKAVKARAAHVRFLRRVKGSSWLEMVLDEGRNREIRRLLANVGHKVRTLRRVAIGPLKLGDLPVGAHRELTQAEVRQLRRASSTAAPRKQRKPATKKSSKSGNTVDQENERTASRKTKPKSRSTRSAVKRQTKKDTQRSSDTTGRRNRGTSAQKSAARKPTRKKSSTKRKGR